MAVIIILAFIGSKDRQEKWKYIIWGVTTMIAIAPLSSFIIAIIYAIYVADGFAGVAVLGLLFPVFFLVGLVVLIIGIYKAVKS
ncbi:hypothetical protein [Oceanobacillus damuensis]|uniref:hypothetical protein n=1 Tax=Oceanobacillus damuensis TaxID=937928 RepID=UPI001F45B937|nr:hypothetical protein [Oceanobacillus damuensis]